MNVSVVIPALNEEATVANVVALSRRGSDEVIVIDSDSTDATAARAKAAGASVVNWRDVVSLPPIPGKGEALWRGVAAARGDVVVFLDADLTEISPTIVEDLARPFIDDSVMLVKAAYTRGDASGGGGRVTELTARPLLEAFFPELGFVRQPLGGEYAIRRSAALDLPFVGGYGVEVGLLIDVFRCFGAASIVEVEAGHRGHRHRPLRELAPMARVVASTILQRAGVASGLDEVGQRLAISSLESGVGKV
ncbi:glucosyl-3-phosphoglycerate synthase [Corynebacterium diphtheriae]|nr:glucosyl-3-phosphoglycerate synthase [Corynebacterium diphtheriae]